MKKKICLFSIFVSLLVGCVLLAHPHFQKSVKASTQSVQVEVTFNTYPYNEAHLAEVDEGFVFHCGRGTLTVTGGDLGSGVKAGTYQVRAQAASLDNWTLFLLPEGSSDLSDGIKLDTTTMTGQPVAHHLGLDLVSGHGSTDGSLLLMVSFGPRTISAPLGTL